MLALRASYGLSGDGARFPNTATFAEATARALVAGEAPPPFPSADAEPPATHAEMEGWFGHLFGLLDEIDFHKGKDPAIVVQRLRRLFQRAQPDSRELRILRGILSDVQRLLRR